MRVIAGAWKGRSLTPPKGRDIRPTSDRVRASLFDILGPLDGLCVLDAFAGSGALGLEALSRGARKAVFVDGAREAADLIRINAERLGAQERAVIWRMDAARSASRARKEGILFDLLFFDPPYGSADPAELLAGPAWEGVVSESARAVWECSPREAPERMDPAWEEIDRRRYGGTLLLFFRWTRR